MGWPLRMFDPLKIYFVTVRCFQRRLLMRPSSETNDVLGGVLARAAHRNEVELFAFVFASNHLHLLVRAPRGNLPRFMQYLLTNASKKVGRLVRWKGKFWERRYSAEPVLDEIALLGDRNEARGRDITAGGGAPAHERLETHRAQGLQVEARLIFDGQLVVDERLVQRSLQLDALTQTRIHLRSVELVVAATSVFRRVQGDVGVFE